MAKLVFCLLQHTKLTRQACQAFYPLHSLPSGTTLAPNWKFWLENENGGALGLIHIEHAAASRETIAAHCRHTAATAQLVNLLAKNKRVCLSEYDVGSPICLLRTVAHSRSTPRKAQHPPPLLAAICHCDAAISSNCCSCCCLYSQHAWPAPFQGSANLALLL